MVDKLTVADDILQIAHQTGFEEHDRVDALLAAIAIIRLRQLVEKIQIDCACQAPIEI